MGETDSFVCITLMHGTAGSAWRPASGWVACVWCGVGPGWCGRVQPVQQRHGTEGWKCLETSFRVGGWVGRDCNSLLGGIGMRVATSGCRVQLQWQGSEGRGSLLTTHGWRPHPPRLPSFLLALPTPFTAGAAARDGGVRRGVPPPPRRPAAPPGVPRAGPPQPLHPVRLGDNKELA